MSTRNWLTRSLGGALAVSILTLAACGSDDPDTGAGGVATVATSSDTSDASSDAATATTAASAEAPTDRNEAFVLYDQCMAEQGFPTDASGAADDGPVVHSESAGSDQTGPVAVGPGGVEISAEDMDAFQAANDVCDQHLANIQGEADLSPDQQVAMDDALLKVEQCMADKGFHIQLNAGGGAGQGTVNVDDGGEGAEAPPADDGPVDQAAMDTAMQECSKVFDDYPQLADVPVPGRQ